jgi:predicted nuclease of predicted toxin-antitoxin system
MKVLIDAMLPWRLANLFRAKGHEARHVRRLKEQVRTDRQIWDTALANGEIVITSDKDFTIIQSERKLGKLIRYRSFNRNRAQILRDFEDCMAIIEAFAKTAEPLLELH